MDSVDSIKVKIIRLRNELTWINDDSGHGGPNRQARRTIILGEISDLERKLGKSEGQGSYLRRRVKRTMAEANSRATIAEE
jgi:hypothetical protein